MNMSKKSEEFMRKNLDTAVYKASWNDAWTKIKYRFVDGSVRTLKESDVKDITEANYKMRWIND